jgi:hypothetical protein
MDGSSCPEGLHAHRQVAVLQLSSAAASSVCARSGATKALLVTESHVRRRARAPPARCGRSAWTAASLRALAPAAEGFREHRRAQRLPPKRPLRMADGEARAARGIRGGDGRPAALRRCSARRPGGPASERMGSRSFGRNCLDSVGKMNAEIGRKQRIRIAVNTRRQAIARALRGGAGKPAFDIVGSASTRCRRWSGAGASRRPASPVCQTRPCKSKEDRL